MDLHWTFLLVPVAIFYFSYQTGIGFSRDIAVWYASVAVLLFVFILIHELGHALVARSRNVKADRIILFPLGGGAYLPERPESVLDEVLIYSAGPFANFLVAALTLPILLSQPDGELILRRFLNPFGNYVVNPTMTQQLLGVTIAVNVLLAASNLLPAYPLDGGRILRALLRKPFGERPATVVVTVLGFLIGSALIYVGYRLGDPVLGIGAGFIISMSIVTFRSGWQRRRLEKHTIDTVIRRPDEVIRSNRLYTSGGADRAVALFETTDWPVLPIYDSWNQLRGFVAKEVIEEEDPTGKSPLSAVAELEFVTAKPGENLLEVTEKIVDANVYGAAVYEKRGHLVGFVFTEDVMKVLGK